MSTIDSNRNSIDDQSPNEDENKNRRQRSVSSSSSASTDNYFSELVNNL